MFSHAGKGKGSREKGGEGKREEKGKGRREKREGKERLSTIPILHPWPYRRLGFFRETVRGI